MWSDRLIEGQLISFRHCQGPVVARCVSDRRKIRTFRASASIPTNCISWPLKPRPTVTSMASSELPIERIDRKIRFFKFNFPNGHQRHLVVNAISIQNRRTRAVMENFKWKNVNGHHIKVGIFKWVKNEKHVEILGEQRESLHLSFVSTYEITEYLLLINFS